MFDQERYKMQCLCKQLQLMHQLVMEMKILTPLMMMISYAEVAKVKTNWTPGDYMYGYDASADSVGPVVKRITKKDLTASQLNKANVDFENPLKGLELSLFQYSNQTDTNNRYYYY